MKAVLVLACVAVAALAAPTDTETTTSPTTAPANFVAFLKDIERQPFFQQATTAFRVLTFEILTAAQTNHLGPFLDRLGYVRLLKYLDALPKDYSHRFISYSIAHLESEGYVTADHAIIA